jgi:chromate transporter
VLSVAVKNAGPEPVGLAALYGAFLKASLCGFGGGLLVWTRRVLVEERRWLTEAEFADTLSLCQVLPGANFANLSVCVGARYRGAAGAIAALLGLTLLPLIVALGLGALYLRIADLAIIRHVLAGVSAAAAGMVVGTGLRMLQPYRRQPAALIFAALAFAAIVFTRLPLPVVLLGLAPFSIAASRLTRGVAP